MHLPERSWPRSQMISITYQLAILADGRTLPATSAGWPCSVGSPVMATGHRKSTSVISITSADARPWQLAYAGKFQGCVGGRKWSTETALV